LLETFGKTDAKDARSRKGRFYRKEQSVPRDTQGKKTLKSEKGKSRKTKKPLVTGGKKERDVRRCLTDRSILMEALE